MSPSGKISEAMVEALRFYADARNWTAGCWPEDPYEVVEGLICMDRQIEEGGSIPFADCGDRARQVLAALSVPTPGTGGAEEDFWGSPGHERTRMLDRIAELEGMLAEAEMRESSWRETALSTPPAGDLGAVKVNDRAKEKLKLWFFRDLNDEQRLKLFSLFEMPTDEIGEAHGRQSIALKHVLSALSSSPVGEMDAATIEACAQIAETDQRSPMAKKSGHKPEWYKHGLSIAKRIRNLAPQGVR